MDGVSFGLQGIKEEEAEGGGGDVATMLESNQRLQVVGVGGLIDSGSIPLWGGYHESRICSRDTYPESYITKYTSIRRTKT